MKLMFFYGSLKRGYENNHRLAGQDFVADAVTPSKYRIVSIDGWGGLIEDIPNGLAVIGELWRVGDKCLHEIDDFETGEGLWRRLPVEVDGFEGAESYFWTGEVTADAVSSDRWPFE